MSKPHEKKARTGPSSSSSGQQLVDLHRGSYLSQSALRAVLENVRDNGLPANFTRQAQTRAVVELCNAPTPFGRIVQEIQLEGEDGTPVSFWTQSPAPLLYTLVRTCEPFRELVRDVLVQHPCSMRSPWRVVVYFDGISPQNPLAKGKDNRAVETIYWSFLEFGLRLWDERLWFSASALRKSQIAELGAGMSEVVAEVMLACFVKHVNFESHGVTLDMSLDGDASDLHTLCATHYITIADEVALMAVLMSKGHAGTKPCPLCRNILDHKRPYVERDTSGTLLPMTSLEPNRWKPHTDKTARQLLVRLGAVKAQVDAGELPKAEWQDALQLAGWNYHKHNIILNEQLKYKAISTLHFDYMHVWLVDGVFQREINALLSAIRYASPRAPLTTPAEIHAYMMRWSWPKQHNKGSNLIFETGALQATASQLLGSVTILRKYVLEVVSFGDGLKAEVASFLACCDVVELLHGASIGLVPPADIQRATERFLGLHLAAYVHEWWAYKHHMSMHIAAQFARAGLLLSCFVHERKHKVIKRSLKDHFNTQGYEFALMLELTSQCIHDLKSWSQDAGLIDPKEAPDSLKEALRVAHGEAHGAMVSMGLRTSTGSQIWRGDTVLLSAGFGHCAADVWFHVHFADRLGITIRLYLYYNLLLQYIIIYYNI